MRISVLGDDSECLRRPVWRVPVCGEAWWRAPERAWLPPCHTPVGCGVPHSVRSRLDTTHANENSLEPSCPERCFVTV